MVRTEDDNTCRSIAALFVLGATELNHVLRSRVGNVDFAQDGIAVVGQSRMYASSLGQDEGKDDLQYASHGIQDHFEHGFGAQTRPYHICDGLRR